MTIPIPPPRKFREHLIPIVSYRIIYKKQKKIKNILSISITLASNTFPWHLPRTLFHEICFCCYFNCIVHGTDRKYLVDSETTFFSRRFERSEITLFRGSFGSFFSFLYFFFFFLLFYITKLRTRLVTKIKDTNPEDSR